MVLWHETSLRNHLQVQSLGTYCLWWNSIENWYLPRVLSIYWNGKAARPQLTITQHDSSDFSILDWGVTYLMKSTTCFKLVRILRILQYKIMKLLILSRAIPCDRVEPFDVYDIWKVLHLTSPQSGVGHHTLRCYQVLYRTFRHLNTFQSTNVSLFSLDIITISFETKYRRSKFRLSDGLVYSLSMPILISRNSKNFTAHFFQKQATG